MEERNLNQLFDALQNQILNIYEEERTDLATQLRHWQLTRRSQATLYFARKHGIKRLGMQPTPALSVSEANGKQAIEMTMLISSLMQSPFVNESWTLQDTSAELVLHTSPKRAFKKLPYTVNVWFDNKPENAFPYVNYRLLYVLDENDLWYKAEGQVDYTGLFFIDANGDKAYFKLFSEDAYTYGSTGQWSVHFNNTTLYPPASSSRPPPAGSSTGIIVIDSDSGGEELPSTSEDQYSSTDQAVSRLQTSLQSEEETQGTRRSYTKSPEKVGVQQRPGQREGQRERGSPPVKRAKADSSGGSGRRGARGGGGTGAGGGRRGGGGESPVSAAEVGKRHTSVTERHLSRLARLQEEARDPPVISVEGPANCLKCWRYRLKKSCDLYEEVTTVFRWLSRKHGPRNSRILIAFSDNLQRQRFLTYVTIPKNCSVSFGHFDAL